MKQSERRHSLLLLSFLVSIFVLVFLFYLQHLGARILSLETRWLLVASVPLLVGLLAGGYIKKFKGFGIELEALLRNPIATVGLIATDALEGLPGTEKGTQEQLSKLPRERHAEIKRLSFIAGKTGYYSAGAIRSYLRRLPNLEYFEVRNSEGVFFHLIPTRIFRDGPRTRQELERFIRAIEGNTIGEVFSEHAISESVREDESLVNVVPKVRRSRFGILPVVSQSGRLMGIVNTRLIEVRITDEVLAARMRA
jgi:CBS domain-containing protein